MDTNMVMDIDTLCIDTMRTLAMDAVQKANSGHPGTPMSMSPVAYELWQNFLNFDPADPIWPNRDRFVLSVGHASMLLYSLLHLTKTQQVDSKYNSAGHVAVSLDDIEKFRQLDSKCPGHPEYHLTSGVETTTGPLGQGVATSVGMAVAEAWLAAHYNRPGHNLFDYKVYALCGDGDMMEGVSSEAASFAAHQGLGNLCWIYDSNRITIEGGTELAFSEDVAARFQGYGWVVVQIKDANDRRELAAELARFAARQHAHVPTLIIVHSTIAWGSPHKAGTKEAHGEPLGIDEVKLTKKFYGWPEDAQFLVPDGVYDHFSKGIGARGGKLNAEWKQAFAAYKTAFPDLGHEIELMEKRELPDGWEKDIPVFPADEKGVATRESSGKVLNAIAPKLPWMVGGAADLAPSTKSNMKFEGAGELERRSPGGRNMHFGIREHAMGAIVNGMSLSKLRSYGSGFLIFVDYMKPSVRLSALMELPTLFIFTHDSIGVGEDGPTHQPIEQLLSLRSIPGMIVMRPADANEVAECWRVIVKQQHQPVCLILSRQPLPTYDRTQYAAPQVEKGAYVMADAHGGEPQVILIGTGSEVQFCIGAHETLKKEGIKSRVVSMPSWELFEQQDKAYRKSVLPDHITARVTVEQSSVIGWDRYAGSAGAIIGMHTFGASAPLKDLLTKFGFSPDAVADAARKQIAGK